jgi:hypothetical protein
MSSKRRTWIWIVAGVFIVLIFLGIGAIIATTAWVQQNVTVSEQTEGGAQKEFDEVRAKYGQRPPLLELRNGRPVYAAGKPTTNGSPSSLDRLHVLVWDPDESKLASVSIPFWFLRLKTGPIRFSAYASGFDDGGVDLTPEEIERHGPGIVLDTTSPKGERVLLWAQ